MAKAHRAHAVETLAGRLRYLSASSADASNRQDRQAINSVIQGSAADLLKCAMILLWGKLEALDCDIILQIHDELILEAPGEEAEKAAKILSEEMEHVVHFRVPLTADCHIGRSWYDAK